MSYKLYVPAGYTQIRDNGREYVEKLKKAGAETVFIVPDIYEVWFGEEERDQRHISDIKFCVDFLKAQGFTVGIWFSCFGVGSKLPDYAVEKTRTFSRKKSILGVGGEDWREKNMTGFCCEDEGFRKQFGLAVEKFAKTEPDMIMLDDDMCISVVPGLGCFCEKHMQIYRDLLGEDVTIEQMKERVFTGYNEKYRKVWLKAVGDSLRKFAKDVRAAIDKVNPSIRAGFATGYTSFDIEGADAFELAEIMAGDTLPFLRLTGAPYWCETNMLGGRFTGQKTPTVIEYVRMQKEWSKGRNIEFFFEGDTYPRSAYYTSAAMCEAFDLAIRAIGGINGQKYLFPYTGKFTSSYFENTYFEKHLKNKPFYEFVSKNFDGKSDVGVKIYEKMRKMEIAHLPEKFAGEVQIMEGLSIPKAPQLLSVQGIPMCCNASDVAVAFGDSVKDVEILPNKLILDIKSALILQNERGIDLGIKSCKRTSLPKREFFGDFEIRAWMQTDTPAYYHCDLSEDINVEDYFFDLNGRKSPASYIRKVGETEFLIYLFDMAYIEGHNELLLSYPRKAQIAQFIGNKIPHVASRCSGAYMICKTDGKDTAVLVQNHWEDSIEDLAIQLDREYKEFEIFGADGRIEGDKFILTTTLYPLCSVAIIFKG